MNTISLSMTFIYLFISLTLDLSVYLYWYAFLFNLLDIDLSNCTPTCLYLYIYPSIHLPIHMSVTPVVSECREKEMDIFFLLDSSTSIYVNDFMEQQQFVRDVINRLDINELYTRVGVLTFSDDYTVSPCDCSGGRQGNKRQGKRRAGKKLEK